MSSASEPAAKKAKVTETEMKEDKMDVKDKDVEEKKKVEKASGEAGEESLEEKREESNGEEEDEEDLEEEEELEDEEGLEDEEELDEETMRELYGSDYDEDSDDPYEPVLKFDGLYQRQVQKRLREQHDPDEVTAVSINCQHYNWNTMLHPDTIHPLRRFIRMSELRLEDFKLFAGRHDRVAALSVLNGLKKLTLDDCQFDGVPPEIKLPKVEGLILQNMRVPDRLLNAFIRGCPNLLVFRLRKCYGSFLSDHPRALPKRLVLQRLELEGLICLPKTLVAGIVGIVFDKDGKVRAPHFNKILLHDVGKKDEECLKLLAVELKVKLLPLDQEIRLSNQPIPKPNAFPWPNLLVTRDWKNWASQEDDGSIVDMKEHKEVEILEHLKGLNSEERAKIRALRITAEKDESKYNEAQDKPYSDEAYLVSPVKILELLGEFPNLEELHLHWFKLTGHSDLEPLEKIPKLRKLVMVQMKVDFDVKLTLPKLQALAIVKELKPGCIVHGNELLPQWRLFRAVPMDDFFTSCREQIFAGGWKPEEKEKTGEAGDKDEKEKEEKEKNVSKRHDVTQIPPLDFPWNINYALTRFD